MTEEPKVETEEKWRWSSFWQRVKRREVTGKDLDALTFRVVIPFLSPGLSSLFLNTENAAGDWASRMACIWLAPPLVALCCLVSYCMKPASPSIFRKVWGIVAPVGSGLLLAYISIGYFIFANAFTGSDVPVAVYGQVVKKYDTSGRLEPNAYLYFLYEGRVIDLKVSLADYKKYNVGDIYGWVMYRGGFGYFYRWKWSKKVAAS